MNSSHVRTMPIVMQIQRCLVAAPLRPLSSIHGSRSEQNSISNKGLDLPNAQHSQPVLQDSRHFRSRIHKEIVCCDPAVCSVNYSISSRDEGQREGNRTSIREISDRISITSRAAWRLDANSTLGILVVCGWDLEMCCVWVLISFFSAASLVLET